ncbi:unnamed protein product [Amoebophrya sp. A25]|nr:unnamed protein product [Amoebophrya sp. A25]|eukprot:GSA25T00026481001.1
MQQVQEMMPAQGELVQQPHHLNMGVGNSSSQNESSERERQEEKGTRNHHIGVPTNNSGKSRPFAFPETPSRPATHLFHKNAKGKGKKGRSKPFNQAGNKST